MGACRNSNVAFYISYGIRLQKCYRKIFNPAIFENCFSCFKIKYRFTSPIMINTLRATFLLSFILLMSCANTFSQMPSVIEKNGRHVLMVDGQPFFILGGQVHNSSAWPGMMPGVWLAVEKLHANTLEVPLYWEQIEATPDQFDFSVVDTLLAGARRHHVKLVFLWFATWKNGSNHYMPEWMKRDAARYPDITGKNGRPVDSPSPNIDATMEADIKAFTQVMRYLKKADPEHSVIMMQVENESGAWGSVRDFSQRAQKLFDRPVPVELLKPEVLKALNRPVNAKGTWTEVFGDRADEYFQAWSVARFIGQVAAAGKTAYPLPMYVNAALRDPLTNPTANTYESGGPTDNVIPIWKAAAPAIDLLAPDIYLSGSERILKVIDLYDRPDNPLFVPEAGLSLDKARYLYEVIAHGGIGFSPFGIDDNGQHLTEAELGTQLAPFSADYKLLAPMMPEIAQWASSGMIKAAVERENHAEQVISLGKWDAVVSFGTGPGGEAPVINPLTSGKAMIVKLADDKFLVIGSLCHITFRPAGKPDGAWQYLKVEEGSYANGRFNPLRILNGDETDWGGPRLGATPSLLLITLVER
jgi:hypothetical protein